MTIAAEFAKNRYTLGVPISTLQGISHPLANIAITVQGGRNLARRAAWFLDNEPDERPELAPSAFVFMAEEASKAATMAVQVQGGLGVSRGGGRHRVSGPGPRVVAGRRRSRCERQVHRRDRRRRAKATGAKTMDFSRVAAVRRGQAFLRRGPRLPARARHRGGAPPRPRNRRQLRRGRASGARRSGIPCARMEAGVRGRVQPGSERRIWQLEKRRAHVPWVTFGTTAMIARSVEKFGSPELKAEVHAAGLQRPGAAVPRLHRARGRLRRRDLQDPRGARRRRLGDQRLQDVHHRCAQLPVRLPDHQHRPRCAETQEPHHVSGAARLAGDRDPGHPHRRRRPDEHRLLQRRPRRRQVPARRGERRLDGGAGTAQRRARRGGRRRRRPCRTCRS